MDAGSELGSRFRWGERGGSDAERGVLRHLGRLELLAWRDVWLSAEHLSVVPAGRRMTGYYALD